MTDEETRKEILDKLQDETVPKITKLAMEMAEFITMEDGETVNKEILRLAALAEKDGEEDAILKLALINRLAAQGLED